MFKTAVTCVRNVLTKIKIIIENNFNQSEISKEIYSDKKLVYAFV